MEKLKKLQIKVIDDDIDNDNNTISQSSEIHEGTSNIKSEPLGISDFFPLNEDNNTTNISSHKNNTLTEDSPTNIDRIYEYIKNVQKEVYKYMICNSVLLFIWLLFLCIDIYYMVKCRICCEDLNGKISILTSLGIFSTCILVFLVSRYGFMSSVMLFLWCKTSKMIHFLNTVKHLRIDLLGSQYGQFFGNTHEMGSRIQYLTLIHQAIKRRLKQSNTESHQLVESSCKVNLEKINMLQESFLPILNSAMSTHKSLSTQQSPNNKYLRFISTLDVLPFLTLIVYGFMFIGVQNIHLSQVCSQFFAFLCVFCVFLIIFSFCTFMLWLVYFLK